MIKDWFGLKPPHPSVFFNLPFPPSPPSVKGIRKQD
jgi:hypothetical protein